MKFTRLASRAAQTGALIALAASLGACKNDSSDSPIRGIIGDDGPPRSNHCGVANPDFRCIDGSGNNAEAPMMGATHGQLLREFASDYGDGMQALAGQNRPNPRDISNTVVAQDSPRPNSLGASDYLWQWGQFLDHDVDLSDGTDPVELANIPIPAGDSAFDPSGEGDKFFRFNRSIYDPDTGTSPSNPRQQINEITAWIDASNVYGSSPERAEALRRMDGTGQLKTSTGNLLPFNTAGLENAQGGRADEPPNNFFLAGDVRANEQAALTVMHTLFMREHNRQAATLAAENPNWTGERLYLEARRRVAALMQIITYQEFLPALLGPDSLPAYSGYDDEVNAGIRNHFSTAIFRFGHSALSPQLLRLDADGQEIAAGHLALRDAFFAPDVITDEGGIEPLLRGLAMQTCQTIDVQVVDEVRNFLFGPPGAGGFDLVSLNIQRGRDHGLPSYNTVRQSMGLDSAETFDDITSDPNVRDRLATVYATPDEVDLWVGALAEDPVAGSHLGPVAHNLVRRQFIALRDGDRFWYQRVLEPDEIAELETTTLADVIRRNTTIGDELPDDVFSAP